MPWPPHGVQRARYVGRPARPRVRRRGCRWPPPRTRSSWGRTDSLSAARTGPADRRARGHEDPGGRPDAPGRPVPSAPTRDRAEGGPLPGDSCRRSRGASAPTLPPVRGPARRLVQCLAHGHLQFVEIEGRPLRGAHQVGARRQVRRRCRPRWPASGAGAGSAPRRFPPCGRPRRPPGTGPTRDGPRTTPTPGRAAPCGCVAGQRRSPGPHGVHRRERPAGGHTDRRWRPFARRDLMTARPALVDIRLRKPCVLARLRTLGWYVRFIHPLPSSPWTADIGVPFGRGPRHSGLGIRRTCYAETRRCSSRSPWAPSTATVYRSDPGARHGHAAGRPDRPCGEQTPVNRQ